MLEFTRDDLRKLIARQEVPCVSIYTPLHLELPEALHNPAPFKKLLSEAEKQMLAAGQSALRVAKIVQPGRELLADYGFWQQRSAGLAVFFSPYGFYPFHLPMPVAEKLVLADRFHIKPLLPLLHGDGQFYVLAFSQHEVRFLQATRFGERRLELDKIPGNMEEALQLDQMAREYQLHTYVNAAGGSTGIFHTPGSPADIKKEDIAQYTQILAKRVSERLRPENAPLVLCAVEYLQPLYHEHDEYAHTLAEGVHGNPETLSDQQLRELAWSRVEPVFAKAQKEALRRYIEWRATARATDDPAKIIPAAHYGSVDTLLAEVDGELWGNFDAASDAFEQHRDRQPRDVDLVDDAAARTLMNSGTVIALPRDRMPSPSPLAAIFRYPV